MSEAKHADRNACGFVETLKNRVETVLETLVILVEIVETFL